MIELILALFVIIATLLSIIAIRTVMKLHNDNYNYCENETKTSCSREDYEYCSTIRR